MKSFAVKNLCAGYGSKRVLHDINADIPIGKITAITGSNACGKTTLLKCMGNILAPQAGDCFIDDLPMKSFKSKVVAEKISFCAQEHPDCSYLTVKELVSIGRYPCGSNSEKAVDDAMALASVGDYAQKKLGELSGGTLHRAWLALALARQPELLLLDEPSNFLDPAQKQNLFTLLCRLKNERGMTVVMVTHDLELIFRTADCVLALKDGRIIKKGTPDMMNESEVLQEIYSLTPCSGC